MIVKINWKPQKKDIRSTGIAIFVGMSLFFLLLWLKIGVLSLSLFFLAMVGLMTMLMPSVFKFVYFAWMGIAYVMGTISSTILLMLFYYFILTPIGLILRIFRKSPLDLKFDKSLNSYWKTSKNITDKEYYNRMS